jgi:hypothetical protein
VVTLDKSGRQWRGENFTDLAEYIRHFRAGGYAVAAVVESRVLGVYADVKIDYVPSRHLLGQA